MTSNVESLYPRGSDCGGEGQASKMWKLGRETVRLLVKDEDGVIKIRLGRKKAHTIYSVPESVAVRIHTRLLNSR